MEQNRNYRLNGRENLRCLKIIAGIEKSYQGEVVSLRVIR